MHCKGGYKFREIKVHCTHKHAKYHLSRKMTIHLVVFEVIKHMSGMGAAQIAEY